MPRTFLTVVAATVLTLAAAACGSDGASTYEATRPGSDDVRTIPPATDDPGATTEPGVTVVLPSYPDTTERTDTPDTTVGPSGEIIVRDTWFADDGYGGYDWGVVYENTSTTSFEYVDVDAEFLDDDGTVLATSDTTVSLATPGVGALAYFTYDLDAPPASMQVTIGEGDPSDFSASGTLTVGQPAIDESYGALTGLITSTYATDLLDATITAVWRDGSGAVTNIREDYVDAIQASGDTWFSVYVGDTAVGLPTELFVGLSSPGFEPSAPAAELAIREWWNVDVGDGSFEWGAIVDNSGSVTWSGPVIQAKFFDADNRLVTADSAYASELRPGANAVTGSLYGLPAVPERMEVVIYDGGYEDDDPDVGALSIDQVGIVNEDGSATITGQVSSTFADEQSFVELILVWRDAANAVVYSTSTYTDEIPAGGSASFETAIYGDNLPTTAPTEFYWSI